MNRSLLGMLALCLMVGCGTDGYDSSTEIRSTSVVQLRYREKLIDIEAIPGRPDAVQVTVNPYVLGNLANSSVEWTQEGCSTKKIPYDNGAQRLDVSFLEMHSSENGVYEVKLSIVNRYNRSP